MIACKVLSVVMFYDMGGGSNHEHCLKFTIVYSSGNVGFLLDALIQCSALHGRKRAVGMNCVLCKYNPILTRLVSPIGQTM